MKSTGTYTAIAQNIKNNQEIKYENVKYVTFDNFDRDGKSEYGFEITMKDGSTATYFKPWTIQIII